MNIVKAFADWLEDQAVATLGQDLFISSAPTEPSSLYWLVATGGASGDKNVNVGIRQTHTIGVHFRSNSSEEVYNALNNLEALVLTTGCLTLAGYTVIGVSTSGPYTDTDIDVVERTTGLLEVTIETYRS